MNLLIFLIPFLFLMVVVLPVVVIWVCAATASEVRDVQSLIDAVRAELTGRAKAESSGRDALDITAEEVEIIIESIRRSIWSSGHIHPYSKLRDLLERFQHLREDMEKAERRKATDHCDIS